MFISISMIFLAVTPKGAEQLAHLDQLDAEHLERALVHASRRGHAEQLAAPTMTMAVGEQGTFLSGARIPYLVTTGGQTQTKETETELRVLLTPLASDDALTLDLDLRWSRPDFGMAVDGAPAVRLVEASTQLPLQETWSLMKTAAPTSAPTLLHRPARQSVDALWLLVRGALVP